MRETDYILHPHGRNLMISWLVVSTILTYLVVPVLISVIGSIFQVTLASPIGSLLRGGIAILVGIASTAILTDRMYERLGWYKLQLVEDRYLELHYRGSLRSEYQVISFNLRKTKVNKIEKLIWIVPTEHNFTTLFVRPDERDGGEFYQLLDQAVEENVHKAEKQLQKREWNSYHHHFMITRGRILKLFPEEFSEISGITGLSMESEEYPQDSDRKENILKFAENVSQIA
ncbi:MAG: hypothetical protein ACXAE3_02385 [Candidatus Kariarchaeaceae archaeon]|jgi:hypothetical protein